MYITRYILRQGMVPTLLTDRVDTRAKTDITRVRADTIFLEAMVSIDSK